MGYPKSHDLPRLANMLEEYARLMHEYGSTQPDALLSEAERHLRGAIERMQALPIDAVMQVAEPDSLSAIRALRSNDVHRLWNRLDVRYQNKLEGAMMARFAGCTLGAPVEFWSIQAMEDWAKYLNFPFPPTDYWPKAKTPNDLRYGISPFEAYTSEKMHGVPADDDIAYTILGLLIAEDYGLDFTVEDVGKAWMKYLPYACTAEEVALRNLNAGIPAATAAEIDNPYCQWIGADIRSDPWAYMAPAWPEKAAELAWRDAYISHRRNGIYGEMYFAAAQSAAFAVDNSMEALKLGLNEIPKDCALARDVKWALSECKNIHNYRDARQAVDDHFDDMSKVHTNNNAALVIFGLSIGGDDVTKVISETVAMGMDNDCTAATAGSIIGAIVGKDGVPANWTRPFENRLVTYLTGAGEQQLDDLIARFAAQAKKLYGE